MRRWALFSLCCLGVTAQADSIPDSVHIIHVNDLHSHFDQMTPKGDACDIKRKACVGGYARISAQIQELRRLHPDNSLVLNAGDEFQGTLFYTYYKGSKSAEVLNRIQFDAVTLGNHEFDDGYEHLVKYLRNLTSPVVCANVRTKVDALNDALVPTLELPRLGIAIFGLLTPDTKFISSPGDEVSFAEPLKVAQTLIDDLRGRGFKRIIALTHIGYAEDQDLVRATRGLSLVVGAHSHTFLGDVPFSQGPYPTLVKDLDGFEVPIVTNGKWGYNLGHLEVTFDETGRISAYAGQPIRLLPNIEQDSKLADDIREWRKPFLEYSRQVVGFATKRFPSPLTCWFAECAIGNLVTDAMLDAHPQGDAAMTNSGGLRAGLAKGNITMGAVMDVFPFQSRLVDLVLTGAGLWETLENIVSFKNLQTGHHITSFAQMSGMQIVFTSSNPIGKRLASLKIRRKSDESWEEIDRTANYTIVTLDFMTSGGDFWWPEQTGLKPKELLENVFIDYLKKEKSVTPMIDGRIRDTVSKLRSFLGSLINVSRDLTALW
ncbi:5'-nucleotidase [Protomyces lactucae-debilis]|uniref:5'-nucleotidase n=1 Tax=Protomyces lactucae-debilis TaxID=2754530 RepID=A0A1Y2FDG9_PROLT|nr:5'-nucleotidase [Protomyces lactucae-debilis]ORY81973.1 5'-nucleotidase [Protomyces lactucae-debilis]